jgi:hypothetical protein
MYIPISFYSSQNVSASFDYLIVGGGGAGGNDNDSGGGGAGGFVSGSLTLRGYGSYPIEIGSGGVSSASYDGNVAGGHGKQSSAFGVIAYGGGWPAAAGGSKTAIDGASGGGQPRSGSNVYTGSAIYGDQGNDGGYADKSPNNGIFKVYASGGGGGAGQIGQDSYPAGVYSGSVECWNGGDGGDGKIWLDGNYYAGGGGGGVRCGAYLYFITGLAGGAGGLGGGGNGANYNNNIGQQNGTPNTGGGGGGRQYPFPGYITRGGSGIVKIRYSGAYNPSLIGGVVSQTGSFTYHTFTSSANLTFSPSATLSSSLDMFPSGAYVIYDIGNKACYPGSGNRIYDLCANATATFTGSYETGSGGIIRLNSASNQRITYSGSVSPSTTIVSIWKNVASTFPDSALCDASFNYGIKTITQAGTKDYTPALYTTSGNTYFNATVTPSDITVWHQYATSVSASAGGNSTATSYLDGTGSIATETKSLNRNQSGNGTIYIGFDSAISTRYSNGWLMAHLHYNRTLSADEIQQIYSVFSSRF